MSVNLFLALGLPDEVKLALQQEQEYLKTSLASPYLRFIPSQDWHITLVFLANTPEDKLSAIKQAMAFACRNFSPFRLETAPLSAFPSTSRASVIWAAIKGDLTHLQDLHERLSTDLGSFSEADSSAFKPHISLARVKGLGANKSIQTILENAPPNKPVAWQVDSIRLFASKRRATALPYQVLHSQSLGST